MDLQVNGEEGESSGLATIADRAAK